MLISGNISHNVVCFPVELQLYMEKRIGENCPSPGFQGRMFLVSNLQNGNIMPQRQHSINKRSLRKPDAIKDEKRS